MTKFEPGVMIQADGTRFFAPDKGNFRGRDATQAVQSAGITTALVVP